MNSCFRWFAGFLFSLCFAVSPASAGDSQWIEIQSPHFSVVTDAGEGRGREVAMRFEQMRAVFGTLMTKANVNPPVPMQIVAFRSGKELRQFAPLWHSKPVEVDGLFVPGQDRTFILLDLSSVNPWAVVFHEYAHQLMNGMITAEIDPWFEEGFAEYFSSIEVDSKQARVGKVREDTYQVLQQYSLMKVADLLKVRQQSATYNESGDHRTVFYAESSMVVHYLYDNHLIPKLTPYFASKIDSNVPAETAFQQSFGMSTTDFDKILRSYIATGKYTYYSIPTPANILSKDYPAKPLAPTDTAAILADIHLHSPDYGDKAIAEFQGILKSDPNNAAACRGLGYAYLLKQDYNQAGEYFKRASQADSKDPRVHYYSALMMSREGSFSDKSLLPEMTKEIETAIALDPNFADSYMLLAFAQAETGDPAKGLVTMQKAVSMSPRNEHYRFNLAQMYLNAQKPDQAIPILQTLANSGDPEVARRANEMLPQAKQFTAALHEGYQPVAVDPGTPGQSTTVLLKRTQTSASPVLAPDDVDTNVPGSDKSQPGFLKGTLSGIDCSAQPSATLTVAVGTKTWTMLVPDRKHILVIGADAFSCSWTNRKIAINYHETGEQSGKVISLELQ